MTNSATPIIKLAPRSVGGTTNLSPSLYRHPAAAESDFLLCETAKDHDRNSIRLRVIFNAFNTSGPVICGSNMSSRTRCSILSRPNAISELAFLSSRPFVFAVMDCLSSSVLRCLRLVTRDQFDDSIGVQDSYRQNLQKDED